VLHGAAKGAIGQELKSPPITSTYLTNATLRRLEMGQFVFTNSPKAVGFF